MAHKLADEILSMILAESLSIPDEQFISTDCRTFGRNDNVSGSTVLLVCKWWMKVATPLLYEAIVLRSVGQTHALAVALKQNPDFGTRVKRVRLEGAYSRLAEVFKRCPNLYTLVLLFADITPSDNANALCRSLTIIRPRRVIFVDLTNFTPNNANKKKVFSALCQSIPLWTELREFHFPYSHDSLFYMSPTNVPRREVLASLLKDSLSLEEIHSETPPIWDAVWAKLASNKRIHFYFDHQPRADSRVYIALREAMNNDPELSDSIHFGSGRALSLSLKRIPAYLFQTGPTGMQPLPGIAPHFVPNLLLEMHSEAMSEAMDRSPLPTLPYIDVAVPENIWSRVLEFALFHDHPDNIDLAVIMQGIDLHAIAELIEMRNTLSHVCKEWHRLIQRILVRTPVLTSFEALEALADRVVSDQTLGPQIDTLYLELLSIESTQDESRYNVALERIIRHLPQLRSFINSEVAAISRENFEDLAAFAGAHLSKVFNLNVRSSSPIPAEVFRGLKCLEEIEVYSFPTLHISEAPVHAPFHKIAFMGLSPEPEYFASLHLPSLRIVKFSKVTSHELAFLASCGGSVLELEVTTRQWDHLNNAIVDLLLHCPSLTSLRLKSNAIRCPHFLEYSIGNDTLEEIFMSTTMCRLGKKAMKNIDTFFFDKIKFERFPSLSRIHFLDYEWPILHHKIEKDHLVQIALSLKESVGVDVMDASGKPFRPRVQRRK